MDTEIAKIKGIGPAKAGAFSKLGVHTASDVLSFFPRAYEDRRHFRPLALMREGDEFAVTAAVVSQPTLQRIRRGMELVKFRIADETGAMDVTFFNMPYVKRQILKGETYRFYGKVNERRGFINPVFEPESAPCELIGRIIPIYRLTRGLSQKAVMNVVKLCLDALANEVPGVLPQAVEEEQRLCRAPYAFENIHFPPDENALETARRRLVFEELFVLSVCLRGLRSERGKKSGLRMSESKLGDFFDKLPFSLTNAQKRAISDAVEDMRSGRVMTRLVQGDVGSGKTLVAAACIFIASKNGCQSAFMAPTEILAEQHTRTLEKLLAPFGISVMKLTGGMPAAERRRVTEALADGSCDLCVGTHALISEGVEFKNLAFAVTDEQHRFGVAQRAALTNKAGSPHIMVMSATPIPRTLALIIYGDLDVSIIDEMPPGRQRVETFTVNNSYRARLNNFIEKLCAEGRQVFSVCPMIEENAEVMPGLVSAEEHTKTLKNRFPKLNVTCLHGKMKTKEKDAVMASFADGEIDILVSTTVVEVGVDVPNAALMIVENAERFGLSQLHQLRGRVGRGEHKSYCILVSDAKGEDALARLSIMTKTNDGFKIAEEDLRIRGPGDFLGARQHGLPEMHIADLGADMPLLKGAQDAALKLLDEDPQLDELQNRDLKKRVAAIMENVRGGLN